MSTPELRAAIGFRKEWGGWAGLAGLVLAAAAWLLIGCGQGVDSPTLWQAMQPPGLESRLRFALVPAACWAGLVTTMVGDKQLLFLLARPFGVQRLLLSRVASGLGLLTVVIVPLEVVMLFSSFAGDPVVPAIVPYGLGFVGFGLGVLIGRSVADELVGFLLTMLLLGMAAGCLFGAAAVDGLYPALCAAGQLWPEVTLACGLLGLGPASILLRRDALARPSHLVAALGVFVVLCGWCFLQVSWRIESGAGSASSLQRVAVVGMNREGLIVGMGRRTPGENVVDQFSVLREGDGEVLRTLVWGRFEDVVVGANESMAYLRRGAGSGPGNRWNPVVAFHQGDRSAVVGGEDVHRTARLGFGSEHPLLFVWSREQSTKVRPLRFFESRDMLCSGTTRSFEGSVAVLGWAGDDMILAQYEGDVARLLRAHPAWPEVCGAPRGGRDSSGEPQDVEVLAERAAETVFRLSPNGDRWAEESGPGPSFEIFSLSEGKPGRLETEPSVGHAYLEGSFDWLDSEHLYFIEREAVSRSRSDGRRLRYSILSLRGGVRHIETSLRRPASIAGTLGETLILTRGHDVGLLRPDDRDVEFVTTQPFGQRQSANFGVSDSAVHYVDEYGRLKKLTVQKGVP